MRLLPVPLHPDQQKELLKIARQAVENYVRGGKTPEFQVSDPVLCEKGAAFVTLRKKGALRGCVGHLFPVTALHASVRGNAIAAASRDSRFEPVTREELKDLKIEISVLSVPQRAAGADEIVMGEHGVIVKKGSRLGVFLPQVAAETGWSKEEFLSELCAQKAGLPRGSWKDPGTELSIFTVQEFGEPL